ncbi:3-deoxy-7-phosphoheptulonate synthase [Krasilnikovia sp. MM14-A1259]|uniref:3-deoxy-7-phosphoheptulonate synthase n=1 Tax=Krasilnikovia sp. MM14-A1259 TaxID=3373539 RepID=UPI0038206A2F
MHLLADTVPRFAAVDLLPTPAQLRDEIPLPLRAGNAVHQARDAITRVLHGTDDRLVVVAGPCSVHDPAAALSYAERLLALADRTADDVIVVMRVYVEKPRTRLGWKGLVSDPDLNGSDDLGGGLRLSRRLMVEIANAGLPVACEFLDPVPHRYLSDAVSWSCIGARTVQSPVHRQFASGLHMPVGIKNATNGGVEDAVDAIVTASRGHVFPGITEDGQAAVVATTGNPDCHVVLRGGSDGPNYTSAHVARALGLLGAAGLPPRVFIDASHGNSGKDHRRQAAVVADIAGQVEDGQHGIAGVMLESFIVPGRQELVLGEAHRLTFGQSVTDACVGWRETVRMVEQLARAAAARRPVHRSALAA